MTCDRWVGVVAVLALALILVGVRALGAPLMLYPASASLPHGPYLRTLEAVAPGTIVAFTVPDVARRYQAERGAEVARDFLFLKPIIAGPGDRVCNSVDQGLVVNGIWLGPTASRDTEGRPLPVWTACRVLGADRYFAFSDWVPNSFDSRYFGPVDADEIAGVYRPLFVAANLTR